MRHAHKMRGGMNPNSSLEMSDIWVIRKLGDLYYASRGAEGKSPREMSDYYRVSVDTIRRIIRRESWNWVSEEPKAGEDMELKERAAASLERLKKLLPDAIPADLDTRKAVGLPEEPPSGLMKLQETAKQELKSNAYLEEIKGGTPSNEIPRSPLDE